MGPVPSTDGCMLYFSDSFVCLYTPKVSAILEARLPTTPISDIAPSLLLADQTDEVAHSVIQYRTFTTPYPQIPNPLGLPLNLTWWLRTSECAHLEIMYFAAQDCPSLRANYQIRFREEALPARLFNHLSDGRKRVKRPVVLLVHNPPEPDPVVNRHIADRSR
jgi:hypothetical protein